MTESELIVDLGTIFKTVGASAVVEPEDAMLITVMQTNVFEEGTSEANRKPSAQRRNIRYYVFKRGQGAVDEKAYYFQGEPFNSSNRDVSTASATLDSTYKIYQSQVLRGRTMSAMIDASHDIINESEATADHAKRMKWARDVIEKSEISLSTMMMFVSQNVTVQSSGGQATDNDIKWIVNSSIAATFVLFGY